MSELTREMKRKRDEEARLAQRSPEPVFIETEGGQVIQIPKEVLTRAVESLNGLAGALTLEAGANITIEIEGATITISGPDPGAKNFLQLTDTPGTYIGEQGKVLKVNSLEDALEFAEESGGASIFLDLRDTPSDYVGQAGKVPAVNATEDGLVFAGAPAAENGIPPGGTEGQILAKASDADYDAAWVDPPAGGGYSIGWNIETLPGPMLTTIDKPT